MEEYIKYQAFQNKLDFEDMTHLLKAQNIPFETEDYPINFIADKANNNFSHEYVIKLQKNDFVVADKIQEEIAEMQIKNVDPSYYLFEYSIDELKQILKEQDAWSTFDVSLTKRILKDKGIEISSDELSKMHKERIQQLSEPDKKQHLWIVLGYISALFGGAFGILIGWHLMNHKRILPNGEKIFDYSEFDRKHGKIIMYFGLIVLGISSLLRIIEII